MAAATLHFGFAQELLLRIEHPIYSVSTDQNLEKV